MGKTEPNYHDIEITTPDDSGYAKKLVETQLKSMKYVPFHF